VEACNGTISGLLDMARDSQPERRTSHVLPVIHAAMASLSLPAGVRLEIDVAPELQAYADTQHLKQILANLLDNSLKALGGRGWIRIQGNADERGTELLVEDDGPGVPPELGDQIFDVLVTTRPHGT